MATVFEYLWATLFFVGCCIWQELTSEPQGLGNSLIGEDVPMGGDGHQ
jgi:hypothetical protein